ncbi:hypothetical protein IA612_08450 [Listeria seeligeri]|uniref:hypothetical protein n=1 Tax=Listeria seeligeri TaxID=1640 RepID=UPI0016247A3A|nr:hypothetical protein [Listeria seeligeri]MBC1421394.1 hypothetical protein [Listeria seeligeri]MBC1751121.1 hypothetical protein [Listeria seeligeri]MBC1753867.1 hypothetical protein [Listeria seeligeri]MBC1787396.1 hypothetical protein [Listeria seeligeri]MBC1829541.1 hypothetical protein [Listeria seeligeri]
MIIKTIAVGNAQEAYIEKRINENLNVISSDDNNKGKTIIIQSLMYCLGNEPVFPSSFKFKKYYYIIQFEHENTLYTLSRKNDTFVLYVGASILIFDNVSELKRYWTKHILPLPQIVKNNINRIVDPELFNQIFFVGQDKKDSANVANKGFYSKKDFHNMLYAYMGIGEKGLTIEEISVEKSKLKKLKEEKKTLLKKHKILNSKKEPINYISKHSDRIAFEEKVKQIEKVKDSLVELKNSRNRTMNRRVKYEVTLKELRSLNRNISTGELQCLDCNSRHIGYVSSSDKNFTFDVSTTEVRSQIIDSINEKISSYTEELDRQTSEINMYQLQLQDLLDDESISLESIVLYKDDFTNIKTVEKELAILEEKIIKITSSLKLNETNDYDAIEKQNLFIDEIISEMNFVYKQIDPNGTLIFDDIFTKKNEVFSGSEATEFHLSKLYALAKVLQHPYPIVIDSFRAEDLSTDREQIVINLFNQLENQIVFTTTLKKEEIGKYNLLNTLNHIDYSLHEPSKILKKEFSDEFHKLAKKLMINIASN